MSQALSKIANDAVQMAYNIPSDCPVPDYGLWDGLITLWVAKFGGGTLIGGAVLGWVFLGLTFFSEPIGKLMRKLLGFNFADIRETVQRRKERDKELAEEENDKSS